jgi:hypothetical protein
MNEEFINPIDKKMVADNPGLMEYAHSAGGAVIKKEDMGKTKGRAQLAMRQQTDEQLLKIYRQMEVLAQQTTEIKDRITISERIYDAEMGFEPLINHQYFLYEKRNGNDQLSMVSPDEWGRSFPFNEYLASVTLLADHTWKVLFAKEDDRDEFVDVESFD